MWHVSGLLSFFWTNVTPSYGWTTFCYPSSAKGHVGCFRLLAIVSSAAVNMVVQVSGSLLSVLWGGYPEVELPRRMVIPFFKK